MEKLLEFRGESYRDLLRFPSDARQDAGYQLGKVQVGEEPDDWKPMTSVGTGVLEIRVRSSRGAFRVIYVAKLGDAIYVLHCFQKKSQKTSQPDLEIAAKRYRELTRELSHGE